MRDEENEETNIVDPNLVDDASLVPVPIRPAKSSYFFQANGEPYEYKISKPVLACDTATITHALKFWDKDNQALLLKIITEVASDLSQYTSWELIANRFGRNVTPMQCFIQYYNSCNPAINHNEWTTMEEKKLLSLASKYNNHNWPQIALELGTNRTPIACLRHFQQTLNRELIRETEWTSEEDLILKAAVEKYGVGNWQYVSSEVMGRSAQQCLNRWRKSLVCQEHTISGHWLQEEERRLIIAAHIYEVPRLADSKRSVEERNAILSGHPFPSEKVKKSYPNWVAIAKLVPGKTDVQCREKWNNNLDPTVNSDKFTDEEDEILRQLVHRCGEGNWSRIAEYMAGRTDAMVRSRWNNLQKTTTKDLTSNPIVKGKRKALPCKHLRSNRAKLDHDAFEILPIVKATKEL